MPISCGWSATEIADAITRSDVPMTYLRAVTSTMTPHRVNHLMRELRDDLKRVAA